MKAFKGLLWKDYSISKLWFLGWLALLLFFYAVGISLSTYFGFPELSVVVVFMEGMIHIIFMPLILLNMLMIEGKTQLWLHTPQSGRKLLLSKFIVAFSYSLISLLMVDLLGVLSLSWQEGDILFLPWKESIFFNVAVTSSAVYFSCWVFLYWTIYYGLSKSPVLKKFRWLILFLVFVLYQVAASLFVAMDWFQEFINLWTIKVRGHFFIEMGPDNFEAGSKFIHLPLIPFLLYAILAFVIFMTASWILERKVEV
ncbi:hypothetical protein D3H55_03495 [Bacillus salacetis]|uniref:Uncharacterized protein n=1 Tax=Bacillus salacetis TaxID=2315464 RepID=A0A3A1R4Y7_9BACI|nr:hypothetical protein [Bacillus salacetis]RIW37649.1 hypothetical protein D3H55_03495 [Bacillus salacetis]